MSKGRPCKICKLEKSNPKAYQELTEQILKNEKGTMSKFLDQFNSKHKTNIILMNVNRHKTHMEGNVHELTEKDKSESIPGRKQTASTGMIPSNDITTISFPELKDQHEKFVFAYRANGWKDIEGAAREAGYSSKHIYEIMERHEVKAAINELKAIDFINLKITGNQVIAGLGKVANYTDFIDQMFEEDGETPKPIKEWPEELRCALNSIELTEDVLKAAPDDETGIVKRRRFKYRFESHLKAKQELRKHFMEVELYKKGQDKEKFYDDLMERISENTISPVMALLEIAKEKLPPQDLIKTLLTKSDLSQLTEGPKREGDDLKKASSEELQQRLRLIHSKKQKLCS